MVAVMYIIVIHFGAKETADLCRHSDVSSGVSSHISETIEDLFF